MFNISSFLEKFSKSIKSSELEKEKILEVIEKVTQIKINPKEVEIKDFVVHIKSSPAVKNKVFINKEKILKELSLSSQTKIVDVRWIYRPNTMGLLEKPV